MKRKVETLLLNWKKRPDGERKPLLLNGARQVGKTYILRKFGEEQFGNVVYVNLEANLTVASFFGENISPERLIRYLESASGEKIVPGKTLLIFDEIQSCERALTSLKYFCEEAPQYHVAAAGSLLGVAVNRQRYSFPVGKVETATLFPLDFEEFLWARGKSSLAEDIRAAYDSMEPLPDGLRQVPPERAGTQRGCAGALCGLSSGGRIKKSTKPLFPAPVGESGFFVKTKTPASSGGSGKLKAISPKGTTLC